MPESVGTVIAIAVALLWYVLPLVLRIVRANREHAQNQTARQASAQRRAGELRAALVHGRELIRALESQIAQLAGKAKTVGGPAQVLGDVLARMRAELELHRTALVEATRILAAGAVPEQLEETLQQLEWQRLRLAAVGHMLDLRAGRNTAEMMADADAIAAAHIAPVVDFASARNLPFPKQRPVTVPATDGHEAIWFGLLPEGYPTVFVPTDFGEDLLRWPAVSHEVGHLVWREVPGFAREAHAITGLGVEPLVDAGHGKVDLRRCYSAWLEELFCDLFAVVQLGPVALRGMIHSFAPPRVPHDRLVWAFVDRDGRHFEEHPPPHLRIKLAAHALWQLGYDVEAKALLRQWSVVAGEPTMYGIPAPDGESMGVAVEALESRGCQIVQVLLETQFQSLHGYQLTSIPGLAMAPGLWARARRGAEALLRGEIPRDDARVLIAAAIEARSMSKAPVRSLARAVTRAIIGIHEPQRREASRVQQPRQSSFAQEVREAIVLYEVLKPRRPRSWRQNNGSVRL